MTTSILCRKVRICKLIDTLDEAKCLDVLRLLRDELKCSSLNRLLIKIIFDAQDTLTVNSLDNIEKYVGQIGAKDVKQRSQGKTQMKDKNDIKNKPIFPLFRLPIDLIANTSLFLNEGNIFKFEKCCRMFYEMINNTSYLNKCNNFKTFEITKKRLQQICNSQCSFYKYCKADILKYEFYDPDPNNNPNATDEDLANIFLNEHVPLWNKAYVQMTSSYNNWYINLMESIRLIQFNQFSTLMMDMMFPVDILFDAKRSHLEGICLDHYNDGWKPWKQCMNTFENKYLNLRNQLKQRGEKIKTLEFVNHTNDYKCHRHTITGPRYIAAKYVWIDHMTIDANSMSLNSYSDMYNIHSYPQLKMITFTDGTVIQHDSVINSGGCCSSHINIETMRLIDFGGDFCTNASIFNNQKLIESWNLHNSLKNLTLTITLNRNFRSWNLDNQSKQAWQQCLLAIKNILTKKYYFNLENVNILIYGIHGLNCNQAMKIFQILKNNKIVLKHQFKQLNVGFRVAWARDRCYILKWTPNMNDKLLDQKKCDILQYIAWDGRNTATQPKRMPSKEMFKEYCSLEEQWVPKYFEQFSPPPDHQGQYKLLK